MGTLRCLSKTQKWTFTARKLIIVLFDDDYLQGKCAVGKKGTKNEAMNKEQLGIMKGKILHSCIHGGLEFILL